MANRHVEIGDIWIDVSVREGHALTADVTEHPVEAQDDLQHDQSTQDDREHHHLGRRPKRG